MKALIVGAGGFGRNYARILSEAEYIDEIRLTRTKKESAKKQAAGLCKDATGHKVSSFRDLRELLDSFQPDLAVISAKDKSAGNNIHAVYARYILETTDAKVLVEKPYAEAYGLGLSVNSLDRLEAYGALERLSMNLPLKAASLFAMKKDESYCMDMAYSDDIEILWGSRGCRSDVRNDLGPHAWSLLPQEMFIEAAELHYGNNGSHSVFYMEGVSPFVPKIRISISLLEGEDHRRIRLGDHLYEFNAEMKGKQHYLRISRIKDDPSVWSRSIRKETIAMAPDPMKQIIDSLVEGKPMVTLNDIRQMQEFLEMLSGDRTRDYPLRPEEPYFKQGMLH